MTFRDWFFEEEDRPYPHEVGIIQSLQHMSPTEQVRLDIRLHSPGPGRFSVPEEGHLDNDVLLKKALLDILEGRVQDDAIMKLVQVAIITDRQNHEKYLNQPPDPNTGSHSWHRAVD